MVGPTQPLRRPNIRSMSDLSGRHQSGLAILLLDSGKSGNSPLPYGIIAYSGTELCAKAARLGEAKEWGW
jgi:hypothetical protein